MADDAAAEFVTKPTAAFLYESELFGHPRGLGILAGFRRILEAVTGPLSTQALATLIFGIYIGLVNFTPVFGGLLGDRVLGRRAAVVLGGTLMAAGTSVWLATAHSCWRCYCSSRCRLPAWQPDIAGG